MVDTPDYDDQDGAEVLDEDNTNIEGRRQGGEDAEQFEDLPDVYDVTTKVGDADDDAAEIGEDMDDEAIVADARDHEDADLEDDDLQRRDGESDKAQGDEQDRRDGATGAASDEVELTYAGDLMDVAGAASSAADMESEGLDDDDLSDLDYKD